MAPCRLTDQGNISMASLESLGYMAGVRRLQDAASQAVRTEMRSARHDAIAKLLEQGRVVKAERSTNQFGHPSFKLQLEDAQTGQRYVQLFRRTHDLYVVHSGRKQQQTLAHYHTTYHVCLSCTVETTSMNMMIACV